MTAKFVTTSEQREIPNNKATGKSIRRMRDKLKLTQLEVASAMGFTAGYLCDLEKGKRTWSKELFDKTVKVMDKLAGWNGK